MNTKMAENIANQLAKQAMKVSAGQIYLELRQNPAPTLTIVSAVAQPTAVLLATRLRGWH